MYIGRQRAGQFLFKFSLCFQFSYFFLKEFRFQFERRGTVIRSSHKNIVSPVMLQRRRSVGVSPEYWLIIPRAAACGTGIVKVMGLWNLRRRGSTVTIGETATRLPSSFTTNSGWIGCACRDNNKNVTSCFPIERVSIPI